MRVEIVNHCHRYWRLLAYQLSSLVLHPPEAVEMTYTLHCATREQDPSVHEVVEFFRPELQKMLELRVETSEPGLLRNRAYGRTQSALTSTADWVWFADTDYAFVDRVWEDLAQAADKAEASGVKFLFPHVIRETDWPTGQRLIDEMSVLAVRPVPSTYIPEVRKSVAIGGLQIAHGPTVRRIGYCPEMAAKGPSDEWNFRSDMRFRRHPDLQPQRTVHLRNVIRIRHPNRGYGMPNRHEVVN